MSRLYGIASLAQYDVDVPQLFTSICTRGGPHDAHDTALTARAHTPAAITTSALDGELATTYDPARTMQAFHRDTSFVRALLGPFGSGKSSTCVMELTRLASRQRPSRDGVRRTRFAVVRNTYSQLKDTTIKTFLHWYPLFTDAGIGWGRFFWTPHPEYKMRWRLKDGSIVECEILFRALDRPDQVKNLLSLEITGYWINEAREVPMAVKDALDGRCGRYPATIDGGASWRGGILDTNPCDQDHPFYRLFEEIQPGNHRLFKQPSGLASDAENLENLPGLCERHRVENERIEARGELPPVRRCRDCGRQYYLTLQQGKKPAYIDVYIHGKYGFLIDGKAIYPEYAPAIHDSPVPLEMVKGFPVIRGWDFGLTPATIYFQSLPGPKVNFLRELCSEDMGIERHADAALAFGTVEFEGATFKDWADPAGWAASQTDEKSCVDIMRAKKIFPQEGAVDFTSRVEAMRYILTRTGVGGRPVVQIDQRCVKFRKALSGLYHLRKLQLPGDKFAEEPEKNHPYSDIANAAEYPISKLFNVPTTLRIEQVKQEEKEKRRWREVQKPKAAGKNWATR